MKIDFKQLLGEEATEITSAALLTQLIIQAITKGLLAPGDRLPSIRQLARELGLNRLTVLKSMEELEIEGWVHKQERKGVFVSKALPVNVPTALDKNNPNRQALPRLASHTIGELNPNFFRLSFNDGFPDHRLFPVKEMARAYSTTVKDHTGKSAILYYDVYGQAALREELSAYIHRSRRILNRTQHVMVTRGSVMAIYLCSKTICEPGDQVAMASPGYHTARESFIHQGLAVQDIDLDEQGLDTRHLETILKQHPLKLVYVTPHHHYPTTVTMSAERRLALLKLADTYNFYILEDDYDFEFQYDRRPILPIASIDQLYRVIYVGSFSKSLSPAIRLGYLVANEQIIRQAGQWRKLIDRQGDSLPELAFAKLLASGLIEKTIRRALKVYHQRRDHAFQLLKEKLYPYVTPNPCEGGLAFWTKLNLTLPQQQAFIKKAYEAEVFVVPPQKYTTPSQNYTRMGFAGMTEAETEEAVERLRECLQAIVL